MIAALRVPLLEGAACAGLAPAFDAPAPGSDPKETLRALNAALSVCSSCPALDPCRDWFTSLRPSERPEGVVAGRYRQPKKQRGVA